MGLNLNEVMIYFINSNLLSSLVTVLVGYAAYYVYDRQKRDSKKSMANIILLEIQNAERILSQIAEDVEAERPPSKKLLSTESWTGNKYLFVKDFDRDEWDRITEFYNNCTLYDRAVTHEESMFQKNEDEIRKNMLNVPTMFLKEYVDSENKTEEMLETAYHKSSEFQSLYLAKITQFWYKPNKPVNDVKTIFPRITRDLSLASVGIKLKKLAGVKN